MVKRKKRSNNQQDKTFQKALDDALNYQKIETHPETPSNIAPYVDWYKWEGIEFPVAPKDWKKIVKNNKTIALNVLFVLQIRI